LKQSGAANFWWVWEAWASQRGGWGRSPQAVAPHFTAKGAIKPRKRLKREFGRFSGQILAESAVFAQQKCAIKKTELIFAAL
jgi:hypothetical protein